MIMTQAVIIGGGAAGLMAAAVCAARGKETVVVEKCLSAPKSFNNRQGQMQCYKRLF